MLYFYMAKIITAKNVTKKEVITQHAAVLFRQKGFAATSMRELAEKLGIEASSLYNHIGSKSEILQTICFAVANEYNSQLEKTESASEKVAVVIENIIRFHIHMMLHRFDEVFVANHEWKQLQEPFLSNFLLQRKSYEAKLIALIKKGIQTKEFVNINPHVAVLTILSAVRGLEFWQRHKKNLEQKSLEQDIVYHLLNGLKK